MEDKKNNFQDKSAENSDIDETMSDDPEVNESSHDIDKTNLTEKIDVSEFLELQKNNAKLNDLLLRARAELDNFQKRTEKQLIQAQLYSTEKLSSELLIIMDSLEAAEKIATSPNLKIEDLIEGNTLLLKTAKEVFGKLNIEEINPLNDKFDPDFHQAMATRDADLEENTVLEVMQKGYKLNSKLLRPALVIVSKKIN
tara:strand:- start:1014 stop:1607 length:594 start_codon:yes stop_codon:yes gene_type:complete